MKVLRVILIVFGIVLILLACLVYWKIYAYRRESLSHTIWFPESKGYISEVILIVAGTICLIGSKKIKIKIPQK